MISATIPRDLWKWKIAKGDKVVVKKGLEVGEEILITPNQNLKSGDKIKKGAVKNDKSGKFK